MSYGTLGINSNQLLKLKFTQLTLGGLAQMDRHWDRNTGVAGSIPTGGNKLFAQIIFPSLRSNTKLTT